VFFSKLIAVVLGTWIMAAPCAGAQQAASTTPESAPTFEVVAIKPARTGNGDRNWGSSGDRVWFRNCTLRQLIVSAYDLKSAAQVLGGPKWIGKESFDVEAKLDDLEVKKMDKMSDKESDKVSGEMLQSLLADRFQLKTRQEERTVPIYALVVGKHGAKLTLSTAKAGHRSVSFHDGQMQAHGPSMAELADMLTELSDVDRPVFNRTGLTGYYDFQLQWTPDNGGGIPPDALYPGLFTALEEQLGLKLEPAKGPLKVIVVEHAAEPQFD
jgi:uncharacterized protein (TIGR03435 family)